MLFCKEDDYSTTVFAGRREGYLWLLDYVLKNDGPAVHALAAAGGEPDELVMRLHEQYGHTPLRILAEAWR